jgi:hypothetical protein
MSSGTNDAIYRLGNRHGVSLYETRDVALSNRGRKSIGSWVCAVVSLPRGMLENNIGFSWLISRRID